MRRLLLAAFLACLPALAWAAAPVPAVKAGAYPAEMPVPAKSMLVVHLNGFERVKGKLSDFVKVAFPNDAALLVGKIDEGLKSVLDGRELKGLTKDGRAYFVVHEFEAFGENPFSFVFPVDDPKAFVAGAFPPGKVQSREKTQAGYEKIVSDGDDFFVVEKKDFVIVTGRAELADEYVKGVDALKSKQLGDAAAAAFFQADVSLYVNVDAINDVHGEQIKQFRGFFNLMLDQVAGAGGAGLDKRQIEMIKTAYAGIFQMIDDGKAVVLAGEIKPEGVAVKLVGRFKPDGETGKVLAAETPSKLAALDDLPAGFMNYSASAYGPAIAKVFAAFYREYAAADGDEAGAAKLDEWATRLAKATTAASAADVGKAGVTVLETPDAKATVSAMFAAVKSLAAGASYQNVKLKGTPAVIEADQTHRGLAFHKISLTVDYEETTKALPVATREAAMASMKKLLPETSHVWVAADGARIVQVTAPDWAAAKATLDKAFEKKATAATDPAAKRTRTALSAEASYVGLFDVTRGINFLGEYLPAILGGVPGTEVAGEIPKLKPVKGESIYAGLALILKGDTAVVELFVPTAAAAVVREAVKPLLNPDE